MHPYPGPDARECREYVSEEQPSSAGCRAGPMPGYFTIGPLACGSCTSMRSPAYQATWCLAPFSTRGFRSRTCARRSAVWPSADIPSMPNVCCARACRRLDFAWSRVRPARSLSGAKSQGGRRNRTCTQTVTLVCWGACIPTVGATPGSARMPTSPSPARRGHGSAVQPLVRRWRLHMVRCTPTHIAVCPRSGA